MAHIRRCSRTNCENAAVATMTYGYREATAVVGPLSPIPQPGAFDLCVDHARSVTVPVGWQLVQLVTEFVAPEPSTSDLTALADAIRAASEKEVAPPAPVQRDVRRPASDLYSRPDVAAQQRRSNTSSSLRPHLEVIEGGAQESDGTLS